MPLLDPPHLYGTPRKPRPFLPADAFRRKVSPFQSLRADVFIFFHLFRRRRMADYQIVRDDDFLTDTYFVRLMLLSVINCCTGTPAFARLRKECLLFDRVMDDGAAAVIFERAVLFQG